MSRCVHDEERSSPLTGTDNGGNGDNIVGGSSRPHSSTSAELESGMSALTVQPQIVQPSVPIRTKETRYVPVMNECEIQHDTHTHTDLCHTSNCVSDVSLFSLSVSRYKSKRVYPSIPNQPSEASAHFMCELAKTVLAKAGGTSSTSLFHQPSTSQNHHGPHRALHMCAFQLGLYALGLHNCVSPNWLSRTYSSHVSWITGQAMEIGAPAIWFLIDSWEGHLTPPEAASIADKSSRGSDPNMVRAAAELALSCLPHAHALNPNEIQRAISQVRVQGDRVISHRGSIVAQFDTSFITDRSLLDVSFLSRSVRNRAKLCWRKPASQWRTPQREAVFIRRCFSRWPSIGTSCFSG